MERANVGLYLIQDGLFRYVNGVWAHMLGYTVEEMTDRMKPEDVVHPEDYRGFCKENIEKRLNGEIESVDYEVRLTAKNGAIVYAEVHGSRILHEGKPAVIGVILDITRRRLAEEALKKSGTTFRQFVEQIPLPLCFVNSAGVLVYINERFVGMFGYTADDVPTSDRWWRLAYPDPEYRRRAMDTWGAALEKAAATGGDIEPVERHVTCKDGTVRIVEISGTIMEGGFLATFSDITDRRQVQKALQQSKDNFSTFFNSIDDFLFVLDTEGRIIMANDTAVKRLGYRRGELTGLDVLMLHPPERREEAGMIVREMVEGRATHCPIPLFTREGKQIPVETKVIRGTWNDEACALRGKQGHL